MSLFSGGRFGLSPARAIPALLRGPLARQTLQFDEDRPGPLMAAAHSALEPALFEASQGRLYRNEIKYLR
jgi:hypothetical protein